MSQIKTHAAYNAQHAPAELLAAYPNAPRYIDDTTILFGQTLEQLTGTPAEFIVDLVVEELEGDELMARLNELLAETPEGREIQLSSAQANYAFNNGMGNIENNQGH